MKRSERGIRAVMCIAVLLGSGLTGCAPNSESRTFQLEQTSTRALEDEATRALESVRRAQQMNASTRDDLTEALSEAERSLVHLSGYYLPLLEARARAYNAYSFLETGQESRTSEELVSIEKILLRIAQGNLAQSEGLLRRSAEKLAEARMAVTGEAADAPRLIEELASLLNHAILKGPIELGVD